MARQFEKMTVELSAADRKLLQDIKKQITLLNRPNRTEHTLTDGPQRLTEPETDSTPNAEHAVHSKTQRLTAAVEGEGDYLLEDDDEMGSDN